MVFCSQGLLAKETIYLEPSAEDMTPVLRDALDRVTDTNIKIVLEKGIYKFRPDYALAKYSTVTNHANGVKNVIFPMSKFKTVEIQGNNSELIFHGQVAPFQFDNSDRITIKDLVIDWDIPFTFLAEVLAVNKQEAWRDVKPVSGHQWTLTKDGELLFPGVDGFNYLYLGSTLAFEPGSKRVVHGAHDRTSIPDRVEKRPGGILRIHEELKHYPPVGSLLASKGDRASHRYAPAIQVKNSKDITFDGVTIHHALGMGFLFERSENIQILNSGVHLRDGSSRVISSTADATHFANCKGEVLIENSRFENMLDDGTNVHGTYVVVDEVLNDRTVRVELKHFEQLGFEFAGEGDEIWFIHQPSVQRQTVNTVSAAKTVNERFIELSFDSELPRQTAAGDILENKTWNPAFTLRGSTIQNHRARNIVVKTPEKVLIENNKLSSMMSSILFRGESFFWFESGVVEDVLIRNNSFEYCAYSGAEHAVMYITPRLGKMFNQNELYDRNIRFENNTIKTFDNRIIWADRVDGLVIKNNTIIKTKDSKRPQLYPNGPLFEFVNSNNVTLENNSYQGQFKTAIKVDEKSRLTLKNDDSIK